MKCIYLFNYFIYFIYREEQEKLNVWIALLNLENLYGSKEQVTQTFQRALQVNDPMTLYRRVAAMYIASSKMEVQKCHLCKVNFILSSSGFFYIYFSNGESLCICLDCYNYSFSPFYLMIFLSSLNSQH